MVKGRVATFAVMLPENRALPNEPASPLTSSHSFLLSTCSPSERNIGDGARLMLFERH